jgi:hypothetical protein
MDVDAAEEESLFVQEIPKAASVGPSDVIPVKTEAASGEQDMQS